MAWPAISDESLSSTKACNPCRLLKTRCVVETVQGRKRCQRCIKINKDCTFPPVQKRRPRKRTDVRVADLENEIRSMKGLLGQEQCNENSVQRGRSDHIPTASSTAITTGQVLNDTHGDGSEQSPFFEQACKQPNVPDPGVISDALAEELYDTYNSDFVEHYPLVSFRYDYSFQDLKADRPTLFLAVMAAAARKSHPQLSAVLNKEVLQSYATRVFMNSEKSLELVQAMIITVVWYSPPDGFSSGQHKFYEYIHMAATMALDLGLDVKAPQAAGSMNAVPPSSPFRKSPASSVEKELEPAGLESARPLSGPREPESYEPSNEAMRTRLSCFVLCCGVAISMRRPNMLKYNEWVAGGVKHFQSSTSTSLSDRRLVAWVQLLKIADEISAEFSFDDPDHIAKITDINSLRSLQTLEQHLRDWRVYLDPAIFNGSLELSYHYIRIYLHEIALHDAHSPEDFVPPFSFEKIRSSRKRSGSHLPHLGATFHCITSAHAVIETFLHMDVESLRTLPIFFYVRLSYSMFILEIITAPLIADDAIPNPSSSITRHGVQVDSYLMLLIKHLERVVSPADCIIPSMFLEMFLKLQERHVRNAASPILWIEPGSQAAMPYLDASANSYNSPSSAQLALLEDQRLDSTDTFNHGGALNDNAQASNIVTPNTGWSSSVHSIPTPSQSTAPVPNYQFTDPTLSGFPNKWGSQTTPTGPPAGINGNFDLSGADFAMEFDPSNLFLLNGAMDDIHANIP